jgi:predicted SnoaL-like aldol condensation-catalyzing enzyme
MPRNALCPLVVSFAVMSLGCSTPHFLIEAENARTNTHVVLAFEETVFNKHHVHDGFNLYVSAQYKEHDPMLPEDFDAVVKALDSELGGEFANSRLVVKRTVSQRDLVAVHAFWDQRPGATRGVARLDIYRLVNAKIVEHWNVEQAVPAAGGESAGMF